MRLKNGEKTQLFYKYFFSYAVIFFIPFITISFFVYHEATKIIKEEVIAANFSKLKQVKDISDTRIKDMKSIATNIATDDNMSDFMLMQPYKSKLAIQQLITYNANNSSIDGVFIYIDGHPYIYTSSGTITFDTYAQKSFDLSKNETENLRRVVQESRVPVFGRHQLSSTNEHVVSYIYPISQGNGRKVVFLMKEKSYHTLVQHVLGDFNGANYIFDHHKNMIAATKNNIPVSASEISKLATKEQEVFHKKIAGEDYSISYIRSDLTGWTFITAMPTNQFFSKLEDLQQTIICILIAIAMVGIIIITMVSSRQYKPLQNLVSLLKTKHIIDSNHLPNHAKDELTSLHESILYISDKSKKLHLKMEHQAPYVREQLLLQLISGNIENTNEVAAMLADVGVDFKHKHVFVLLISKRGENPPFSDQSLYTRLYKLEFKHSIGYGMELPDDNSYGIIVSLDNEEVQQQYVDGIIQTVKDMIPQNDKAFSIGVGKIYNELEKINRSFVEAKAAMEYAMITNQGICIYFDQITKQNNTTAWFPVNLQVKLSHSLKQGDYIVANETINEILNYTISIQAPIYMTKAMTYDLTNTMLKVIAEQNLLYDVTDIKRIFKFQSLDELYHMLDRIAVYICKEINQKKRNSQNLLSRKLMDHLQKEFTNPDLSLEKLADYLNLSIPYTSRFIKEQTGYTFTQIIWDMRMKECQRLLLNTSIPIKEIVKQIGYYDVANFTRKFKKEVGITPSQFRKQQMNRAL